LVAARGWPHHAHLLVEELQDHRNGFNNPDVHRLPIPGANVLCTARGLAMAFNRVIMGKAGLISGLCRSSAQVLSPTTLTHIRRPLFYGDTPDLVTGLHAVHGHGFFYACRQNEQVEKVVSTFVTNAGVHTDGRPVDHWAHRLRWTERAHGHRQSTSVRVHHEQSQSRD
jgi:hypothetical protein